MKKNELKLQNIISIKELEDAKVSFEDAYEELDKIINATENGSLSLEDSISYYKRGKILVDYCQNLLSNAKTTIEKIG